MLIDDEDIDGRPDTLRSRIDDKLDQKRGPRFGRQQPVLPMFRDIAVDRSPFAQKEIHYAVGAIPRTGHPVCRDPDLAAGIFRSAE